MPATLQSHRLLKFCDDNLSRRSDMVFIAVVETSELVLMEGIKIDSLMFSESKRPNLSIFEVFLHLKNQGQLL